MRISIVGHNSSYRDLSIRAGHGEWIPCEDMRFDEEDKVTNIPLTEEQYKIVMAMRNGEAILNIEDDGSISLSMGD